ncbi:hypothetical protein LSTR_LSTR011418 [Laodelphax striatellus]|uniref:Bardet-Biedl syndrome 2 protein homolog n=1 Tax=Laodelphax striatellus TaxID=195883 RepID=A0A482WN35_LAOST|nr:hypothetical protein LSTR_LSTR011418 [Laodelphax striatellus]
MMAIPVFTLHLNYQVLPGRITIGKYDGSHCCLTAATTGDKVLIHSPHKRDKEFSLLNINQNITALCAGRLNPEEEKDILIVGTKGSLLAYHVENNSDIFYRQVPDGVNAITIGRLGLLENPLALVGGNCSIQGFDAKGNDPFWTVTGDNVRSLALLDVDGDGENELVVGSDDFELRIFKEDAIMAELTETEAITALAAFRNNRFAYALANGTVGVYDKLHRSWRVKSKNGTECLACFDLDGDGVEELVTGWSSGKVDARSSRTGEVLFRDVLSQPIAGLVCGDYSKAGTSQLIACSYSGEVRGYDSSSINKDESLQMETVRDLFAKKQALLLELKNYTSDPSSIGIPANTRLLTEISTCQSSNQHKGGHIVLALSTNNLTVIRAVTVFAEGIFNGETFVVHPRLNEVSTSLTVPLVPPKDNPLDIHIRAFVGAIPTTEQLHVFELTRQLPRFSMYMLSGPASAKTNSTLLQTSFVSFRLSERVQRIDMWVNQNFLLPHEYNMASSTVNGGGGGGAEWSICVTSLRDNAPLLMMYDAGKLTVGTENMSLAADIVQSLASYLNITQLQTYAEFPKAFDQLKDCLNRVAELQQNATKMAASVADSSNLIRSLVVQAEDARLLQCLKDMREFYTELYQVNEEMINTHTVRRNNHEQLLEALRQINLIIQQAARLRVGKPKSDIVNFSRTAIANNNINALIKIIKTGEV